MLRLSDISKSNDSKELTYLIPVIKDTLHIAFATEGKSTKYFKSNVDADVFNNVL